MIKIVRKIRRKACDFPRTEIKISDAGGINETEEMT